MAQQRNTQPLETDDLRKYDTTTVLHFKGYDPIELESAQPGVWFAKGDELMPVAENKCGLGIDVMRLSDGAQDMVWPQEVAVCEDNQQVVVRYHYVPGSSADQWVHVVILLAGGDQVSFESTRAREVKKAVRNCEHRPTKWAMETLAKAMSNNWSNVTIYPNGEVTR